MLSTSDNLTLLITNKSHKAYLLSCAKRCSSKLQEIQNLENFISMAIQGTQVPMYTKHTLFLYFLIFQFFLKNFCMKNKTKQNWKNNHTKTCWAKQSIKTRLTQNKSKTHKLCKNKNKKREKEKVIESFGAIFLPHPRRTFPLIKTLNRRWGEELKPLKFERNMRALRRSLRGAREDWSWFWLLDAIMLLPCWMASHL